MKKKCILLTIFFAATILTFAQQKQHLQPVNLLCDLMAHTDYQSSKGYPITAKWSQESFLNNESVRIANKRPAFSWGFQTKEKNILQTAYQILVADQPGLLDKNQGNIWDSGKIKTAQSIAVNYAGKELQPNKIYYWKVKTWLNGIESSFSKPSTFFTDAKLVDYKTPEYPLQKKDELPLLIANKDGLIFADFGKATFGQLKLKLTSEHGGDTIAVHLGEALTATGQINRKPGGTIRYQKHIVSLKKGSQEYVIRFNPDKRNTGATAIKMPAYIGEVLPFRFCEIEGYRLKLPKENITRMTVTYPFNDDAADFHSSDSTLNQIWDLCKHSVKATTFAGIYVDGDRERIPYEADAYINQLCHYAADKEFSLARRSHEYLIYNATWPTEWILQSVLMAYNDYLYTGDIRSARHHYTDLQAKLLTGLEEKNGLISTLTGKQNPEFLKSIHFNGPKLRDIVDWPHTGILGLEKGKGGETDGFVFTDYNAVVNAYYYKALKDMSVLAGDLGFAEDALSYSNKAKALKKAYFALLWDPTEKRYRDGIDTRHASLHTNMFALTFGLVPEEYKQQVMTFIRSRGMACSVYGSQFLMDAIYDAGDAEYGLSLLTSKEERSWYNMIREGSTITMEAWGNKFKPNQDWNHVWGAVPGNIIPRKLMGIEPLTPGWATFQIKPQLGSLKHARIKVPTIRGDIKVNCEQDNDRLLIQAEIPANTVANIILPAGNSDSNYKLYVDGKPVSYKKGGKYIALTKLPSGIYEIKLIK